MKLSSGYETKKARIEMLPLIDVVFLLLVFFIYAMISMVVHRGLKVELPSATTAAPEANDYISITIDSRNILYLNAQPVATEHLIERIRLLLQGKEKPVFIDGDAQADLGLAIELLDQLKNAGIEKVSFTCKRGNP